MGDPHCRDQTDHGDADGDDDGDPAGGAAADDEDHDDGEEGGTACGETRGQVGLLCPCVEAIPQGAENDHEDRIPGPEEQQEEPTAWPVITAT